MTAPTLSPALMLLCGASFSGNSSLGHVLADGLGAQIVSLDAINGERGLCQNEVVLSTVRAALSTSPRSCRPNSSSPKDEAS